MACIWQLIHPNTHPLTSAFTDGTGIALYDTIVGI